MIILSANLNCRFEVRNIIHGALFEQTFQKPSPFSDLDNLLYYN